MMLARGPPAYLQRPPAAPVDAGDAVTAATEQELAALFNELMLEVSHSAPGARLSARIRNALENLNPWQRAALVSRTGNGSAPLFIAAVRGNAEVVEYLIHVCCANVEQRGVFPDMTRTDRVTHRVTPLWAAAVAGKVHTLRVLADAGADLNAVSDSGSTPVRSACFMTHIEVVRLLITLGANIHIPNHKGGTCLINSVQSPRLIALLLAAGADVRARDTKDKTALQYAAQEHRCDSARLLLAAGADPHSRSYAGDDALRTAALKGAQSVLTLLVSRVPYSTDRHADALELYGATQIDEFHNPVGCIAAWRQATVLRHPTNAAPVVKAVGTSWRHGEEALGMCEWSTLTELEEVVRAAQGGGDGLLTEEGLEWLRGQALLVAARVLTPTHTDTVYRVMYRGAAYAEQTEYGRCIALWTAALASHTPRPAPCLRPRHELHTMLRCVHIPHCPPTPPGFEAIAADMGHARVTPATLSDALLVACALTRLMVEVRGGQLAGGGVTPQHAHRVAVLLTECLPALTAINASSPLCRSHADIQDRAMRCLAHLVHLMVETADTIQQRQIVAQHCRYLVKRGYRSALTGDTLLHLCVSRLTVLRSTYFTADARMRSVFPCVPTVRALIAAGGDVTARNTQRTTPLHVAALPGNYSDQLVDILIHAGAHMDTPNRHGDTPTTLARLSGRGHEHAARALSLQCIAARALVLRGHILHLPKHLHAFVDLHRP